MVVLTVCESVTLFVAVEDKIVVDAELDLIDTVVGRVVVVLILPGNGLKNIGL